MVKSKRPTIILLMRKEASGYHSIERLFESLVPLLSEHFVVNIVQVPCHSRGVLQCLRNLLFTARLRADVIHVTGDIYYCSLAVPRRRCVLTVHDLVSLNRLQGVRKYVFSLFWYSLPLHWAPWLTAISEETMRNLEREYRSAAGRVEVIPDCVDAQFAGHYRPPHGNSPEPQVLQVGTTVNKNLERVAEASSGLSLRLRIIGTLSAAQRELLDSLDLVWSSAEQLTTEELIREYRESDVLVFASTYEGFGLPIVEAQAIGLPVITSNLPPMNDTAGDGALLVDPYEKGKIRMALQQLLDSPGLARQLSDRGRRNAERFDAETVAGQYADVYTRALAQAERHR